MDRVRFGRALGKGARAAARTAMEAVDAAAAPSPAASLRGKQGRSVSASPAHATPEDQSRPDPSPRSVPVTLAGEVLRARPAFAAASRNAAGSMLGPLRHASRALWHELTGSFFALFALSFAAGVWHSRTLATSSIPSERHRFLAFCALAVLFAYFSISSFLRARRRPAD